VANGSMQWPPAALKKCAVALPFFVPQGELHLLLRSTRGVVSTPLIANRSRLVDNAPMAYAILRTAKISSMGQLATSAQHTFREREVENANALETPQNEIEGAGSTEALLDAVKARLSLVETRSMTKPVICIEYMVTASPEAFSRHQGPIPDDTQYFEDAKKWLRERHGVDNVVSCAVHTDEQTPHLVAYVVPLVEREAKTRKRSVIVGKDEQGKPIRETKEFTEKGSMSLCAKEFLGGRDKLRAMQTNFVEKVAHKYGLDRGKERSTAKHQTVRAFYAAIEQPVNQVKISPEFLKPRLLKKGLLTSEYESEQMVADRVTKAIQNAYAPAVNLAKIVESNQQRTKSIEVTARNTQNQANLLKEQLEKAKKGANELIHIIAKGGEQLLKFQEEFRKGLEKSAEQDRQRQFDRDRGRSR